MKILYLAHRIPYPPNKGDKIRSFHQLTHLAKRHDVWCACFVDCADDLRHVDALRKLCRDVTAVRLTAAPATLRGVASLCTGGTLTEGFYGSGRMRRALRRWQTSVSFDVVAAFSSSMAPYALDVPAHRRVLDLCDLDSQKWFDYASASRGLMRFVYQTEATRLAERERNWLDAFDAVAVITAKEATPLRNAPGSKRLHVIGNGVTLPNDTAAERSAGTGMHGAGANPRVGFVGAMDYLPNVDAVEWFARYCWPRIRAAVPNARFRIIGRSPARRVRRLDRFPGVDVTGEVADISAEVAQLDVSVAPLRIARGLQNKVLEAMAASKPVVLTGAAATGIDARPGRELLVTDEANTFADTVIRLLRNPHERRRIGDAARRYVARLHDWNHALTRFELLVTGTGRVKSTGAETYAGTNHSAQDQPTRATAAGNAR